MKWFLILTLIVVIMLIAKAFSNQYLEKYDFYFNLKSFLNQFKVNLAFKQEKITTFLQNTKAKKQFAIFKEKYLEYLKTDSLNLDEIKILDLDEKNRLSEIVTSLGRLDAKNEIMQLETFLIEIDEKLKKSEEDKSKLCPLILKLSLLFAIGLSILLI